MSYLCYILCILRQTRRIGKKGQEIQIFNFLLLFRTLCSVLFCFFFLMFLLFSFVLLFLFKCTNSYIFYTGLKIKCIHSKYKVEAMPWGLQCWFTKSENIDLLLTGWNGWCFIFLKPSPIENNEENTSNNCYYLRRNENGLNIWRRSSDGPQVRSHLVTFSTACAKISPT